MFKVMLEMGLSIKCTRSYYKNKDAKIIGTCFSRFYFPQNYPQISKSSSSVIRS